MSAGHRRAPALGSVPQRWCGDTPGAARKVAHFQIRTHSFPLAGQVGAYRGRTHAGHAALAWLDLSTRVSSPFSGWTSTRQRSADSENRADINMEVALNRVIVVEPWMPLFYHMEPLHAPHNLRMSQFYFTKNIYYPVFYKA